MSQTPDEPITLEVHDSTLGQAADIQPDTDEETSDGQAGT